MSGTPNSVIDGDRIASAFELGYFSRGIEIERIVSALSRLVAVVPRELLSELHHQIELVRDAWEARREDIAKTWCRDRTSGIQPRCPPLLGHYDSIGLLADRAFANETLSACYQAGSALGSWVLQWNYDDNESGIRRVVAAISRMPREILEGSKTLGTLIRSVDPVGYVGENVTSLARRRGGDRFDAFRFALTEFGLMISRDLAEYTGPFHPPEEGLEGQDHANRQWCHDGPPPEGRFRNELRGDHPLKDLSRWMGITEKTFKAYARRNRIWVERIDRRRFRMWFASEQSLAEAVQRKNEEVSTRTPHPS